MSYLLLTLDNFLKGITNLGQSLTFCVLNLAKPFSKTLSLLIFSTSLQNYKYNLQKYT